MIRGLTTVALLLVASGALTGCGTGLNSGGNQACGPGIEQWQQEIDAEGVFAAPDEVTSVSRTGTVQCEIWPVIGVVNDDPLVELTVGFDSEQSEEEVLTGLQNAAGLSDWTAVDGGNGCLVKVVAGVPSFLQITSNGRHYTVSASRGDSGLCQAAVGGGGEIPIG